MWNTRKSILLTLILTYIAMLLLVVALFALPAIITWYVEYRGREASLPTTIMLTFYPCTPFVAFAFWQLRGVLNNLLKNEIYSEKNVTYLRRLSWCSFAVMAIMLISSKAYMPFFVCALCAGFIGLTVRTIMNLFKASVDAAKAETSESTNTVAVIENEENTL